MVAVVANELQMDGRDLVESCFVVLLGRLAHHQGGFYGDQAAEFRITNSIE